MSSRATELTSILVSLVLSCARASGCHHQGPTPPPPPHDDPGPLSGSVHVALGVPTDADPSDDVLLDRRVFVLSYDAGRRSANWVSWRLQAADLGSTRRASRFHEEESLPFPETRAIDADYRGSGWDRGHLCPSADRTRDEASNVETFSLANVQPQHHDLNAGPWEQLEEHARELAKKGWTLWIAAGGLFGSSPRTIGRGVAVPTASWKVLVAVPRGFGDDPLAAIANSPSEARVVAVIMPNVAGIRQEPFTRYQVTVDEVERRTGYDFFRRLPKDVQDELEARSP